MKTIYLTLLAILCSLTPQIHAESEEGLFTDLGLRFGTDTENKVDLNSYEIFGTIDTDWSWEITESTRLDIGIETAISYLTGDGDAVYGRIAPLASVHFGDFPISIVVSSGPTLYSEDTFDDYDIGGNFQFTTSVGFNWNLCESWALSYRFQHTSNAHLDDPNPGLEMHTLGLAYSF